MALFCLFCVNKGEGRVGGAKPKGVCVCEDAGWLDNLGMSPRFVFVHFITYHYPFALEDQTVHTCLWAYS